MFYLCKMRRKFNKEVFKTCSFSKRTMFEVGRFKRRWTFSWAKHGESTYMKSTNHGESKACSPTTQLGIFQLGAVLHCEEYRGCTSAVDIPFFTIRRKPGTGRQESCKRFCHVYLSRTIALPFMATQQVLECLLLACTCSAAILVSEEQKAYRNRIEDALVPDV